jgi:hypothetical protein
MSARVDAVSINRSRCMRRKRAHRPFRAAAAARPIEAAGEYRYERSRRHRGISRTMRASRLNSHGSRSSNVRVMPRSAERLSTQSALGLPERASVVSAAAVVAFHRWRQVNWRQRPADRRAQATGGGRRSFDLWHSSSGCQRQPEGSPCRRLRRCSAPG